MLKHIPSKILRKDIKLSIPVAYKNNRFNVVKYLLNETNINEQYDDETLLYKACKNNNMMIKITDLFQRYPKQWK